MVALASDVEPGSAGELSSLADRDAAYSPAIGHQDASLNHIANTLVAVIGIVSAVAVIGIRAQTQTEPKSGAAKSTAMETAAAGKGGCGRGAQPERRRADETE